MRVLLISDNHGDWEAVEKVLKKERYDFAIHLGDADVSEDLLAKNFSAYVGGNHDFGFKLYEQILTLEDMRVGILHGHFRGVSALNYEYPEIVRWAKKDSLQAVFHGHTHIPSDKLVEGIRIICPGSVSQPRSVEGATYGIVEISGGTIQTVKFKKTSAL